MLSTNIHLSIPHSSAVEKFICKFFVLLKQVDYREYLEKKLYIYIYIYIYIVYYLKEAFSLAIFLRAVTSLINFL